MFSVPVTETECQPRGRRGRLGVRAAAGQREVAEVTRSLSSGNTTSVEE